MTYARALRAGGVASLDALPADGLVYLRERPSHEQVFEIARWLQTHPQATLRLDGPACDLAGALASVLPRSVEFGRSLRPPSGGSFERVERAAFAGAANVARWLTHLPNVRAVRVVLHGDVLAADGIATARLDALSLAEGGVTNVRALAAAGRLRTIELREVAMDSFDAIGALPELRSLRICAVRRLESIHSLRGHARLRSLWLERLPFFRTLNDLQSLPALSSLHLSGLWQFGMSDAESLYHLPALRVAHVDIGGRRKNVEILKRLRLPAAPAFSFEHEARSYDFTTS